MIASEFLQTRFFIELFYSLIVVSSCLIIYFKTRKISHLTSYKGISYFKNAFLFFAIAYFSRFLFLALRIFTSKLYFGRALFRLGFFIFVFTGLMAAISLLSSVLWKHFENKAFNYLYLFYFCGFILALFTFIKPNPFIFILTALLFLGTTLLSYFSDKKSKEHLSKIYLIYLFLFFAWIANALAHFVFFISIFMGIIIYLFSALFFILVLYKVIKRVRW